MLVTAHRAGRQQNPCIKQGMLIYSDAYMEFTLYSLYETLTGGTRGEGTLPRPFKHTML